MVFTPTQRNMRSKLKGRNNKLDTAGGAWGRAQRLLTRNTETTSFLFMFLNCCCRRFVALVALLAAAFVVLGGPVFAALIVCAALFIM